TCLCIRSNLRVAHAEIKQNCRRYDRHPSHSHIETDPMFFQVTHRTARCLETEGAASSKHDRMHRLNCVDRVEEISVARSGRCATNVYTCYCAFLSQNYSATCWSPRISEMPNLDSCNIDNRTLIVARERGIKGQRITEYACAGRCKSAAYDLASRRF